MTLATLLGATAETVDAVTDVLGIAAVLVALALLIIAETRRSGDGRRSRTLGMGALGATALALVIIGGRFQWIPDAGEGEQAAVADQAGPTTTTSTTASPSSESTSPTSVESSSPTTATTVPTTSTTGDVVGPPTPAPTTPTTTAPPTPTAPEDPDAPPAVDTPTDGGRGPPVSYEVTAGDNFWSIARSLLEAESDGAVSDVDIVPYWQALVDANTDQLVDPGNADLIVPGQVLDAPPIASP